MLTLKAALEEATAAIGRVDAQVIIAHLLGVNRAYLVANPLRVLTETEDARVDMMVSLRASGQPVAYLLGHREFYSRDFHVTPDVLIPRPETEVLVEAALSKLPPGGSCLDLGTGSGAIAVTLACERPQARVTAVDASPAALQVAAGNARVLGCGARVEWLEGSWYQPVAGRTFDVIVSNPPYVAQADPHLGRGDLRFEPRGALTDGSADGLDSIRAIVAGAREHLAPKGWLLLEHGHDQAGAVRQMLLEAGFTERLSLADLGGITRVAGGTVK